MGRCLVVRMVPLMLDRLRVRQAVEGQRRDKDEQGEGFSTKEAHHATSSNAGMLVNQPRRCQDGGADSGIYRIRERIAVYCFSHDGRHDKSHASS